MASSYLATEEGMAKRLACRDPGGLVKFCLPVAVLGMLWDVVGNCSLVDSPSEIVVVALSSDWRKLYLAA